MSFAFGGLVHFETYDGTLPLLQEVFAMQAGLSRVQNGHLRVMPGRPFPMVRRTRQSFAKKVAKGLDFLAKDVTAGFRQQCLSIIRYWSFNCEYSS